LDTIRALGAFHFNLARQAFVTLILAGIVLASGTLALPGWELVLVLAISGGGRHPELCGGRPP